MTDYGIKAQKLFQKHFVKFGSYRKNTTYIFSKPVSRDEDTGIITEDQTDTQPDLMVIYDKFESKLVDDDAILSIDRIAIFPSLNINQEPEVGDKMIQGGYEWNVEGILNDPMPVAYELHVRPRKIST